MPVPFGGAVHPARHRTVTREDVLPPAWVLQRPRVHRAVVRLMWGADGVVLFDSARALHEQVTAGQE